MAAMRKAFDAASDDDGDEDVKAYLANSSDDDDDDQQTRRGLAPFGEDEEEFGEIFVHILFCLELTLTIVFYVTHGKGR